MFINIVIFVGGLTISIIDVNRFNFGLYLSLISLVTMFLLVSLYIVKPACCQKEPVCVSKWKNVFSRHKKKREESDACDSEVSVNKENLLAHKNIQKHE